MDSASPFDVALSRLYFAIDARVWSQTQSGETRGAPVQAGFDALTVRPRNIIELGCGAGGAATAAARRWAEADVRAYDASGRMIRHARRLAAPPNVSFARRASGRVHGAADLVCLLNYVVHPALVQALLGPGGEVLVADSFNPLSALARAHWLACGFEWVAGTNVEDGFFEIYRWSGARASQRAPVLPVQREPEPVTSGAGPA